MKNKYIQSILNLAICGLFVIFAMAILIFILPKGGLTVDFFLRGYKLVGFVSIILSIIFLILYLLSRDFKFKKKIQLPEYKDFLLLALPMSPVLNYVIINTEYLDLYGLLYLVGITLTFTIVFSFIIPILFSYFGSLKMLMISGLALSFTTLTIAQIANNPNSHIYNSQFVTQGLYLIVSFGAVYLLYFFNKKVAYVAVILFMISGIVIQFLNHSFGNLMNVEVKNFDKVTNFYNNKNNRIIKKKNIYILVYESYANLETLDHYGFDNTKQIEFLEKNGFKIYHGIYSAGGMSLDSTARILEIQGDLSKHPRHYTSGNAFTLDVFKKNGYKTIGLFTSPYFFGSSPIAWDEFYPVSKMEKFGGKMITKSVFRGEFKFNTFDEFYDYEKYLKLKKKYLSLAKSPTFFYTHNSWPGHSGNSGKCLPNEKELYFEGLKKANKEMKNDISDILSHDSKSIIVLLADHGPSLTKNCRELRKYDISSIDKYDLQDRYGTFLSIYWPEDILDVEQNIVITQDIVPAILSKITNNKNLFSDLKIERRFFDRFINIVAGINVIDGIITDGKDKGNPLFKKRSYNLPK